MKIMKQRLIALVMAIAVLTPFAVQSTDVLDTVFARNFNAPITMVGGGSGKRHKKKACPKVKKHKIGYIHRYSSDDLSRLIARQAKKIHDKGRHHTKTKGIVGEKEAELVFERKRYYLTFGSFLKRVGKRCNIACRKDSALCTTQYNAKNNGLDNILIPVTQTASGRYIVDTRYRCVIVESKYDDGGALNLGTKGAICDEMTTSWIETNLQRLICQLANKKGQAMKAGDTDFATCAQKGIDQLKIIRREFKADKVLRVATVLDGDGDLMLYLLRDSGQRPASDLSIEKAVKELLSGLPKLTYTYPAFA